MVVAWLVAIAALFGGGFVFSLHYYILSGFSFLLGTLAIAAALMLASIVGNREAHRSEITTSENPE